MAECVPSDTFVLPRHTPAFVMQGQTAAVWNRSRLPAPDTRASATHPRQRHTLGTQPDNIRQDVCSPAGPAPCGSDDVARKHQFQPGKPGWIGGFSLPLKKSGREIRGLNKNHEWK